MRYYIHPNPKPNRYVLTCSIGPYTLHCLYLPSQLTLSEYTLIINQLTIDTNALIFGDLNTRLHHRVGDHNFDSRKLILEQWMSDHGLEVWNETLAYGIMTFYRPNNGTSLIDLFISSPSAVVSPSMTICDHLTFGSDHHLCLFEFYTPTPLERLPTPNAPRQQWKLQRLHEEDVQTVYFNEFTHNIVPISAEIDHHLEHNELDLEAAENIGNQITKAIYDALDNSVTRTKVRPKHWKWFWTEELQQLAEERQQKYTRWKHTSDTINRSVLWKAFTDARESLRLAIRRSRTQNWRAFCSRMQRNKESETNMVIKRMRRNRQSITSFSHPAGPAHATETLVTHLATVFGGDNTTPPRQRFDQLDAVGENPFTIDCIINVIRKELPACKAPGSDHITSEMLKPIVIPLAHILSSFLFLDILPACLAHCSSCSYL